MALNISNYPSIVSSTALPGSPRNLDVVAIGEGVLCVSWSPPNHEGSSPITKYTVEVKQEEGQAWKKMASLNAYLFMVDLHGLKPGNYYRVRVTAENKHGVCEKPLEFYDSVCATRPKSRSLGVVSPTSITFSSL